MTPNRSSKFAKGNGEGVSPPRGLPTPFNDAEGQDQLSAGLMQPRAESRECRARTERCALNHRLSAAPRPVPLALSSRLWTLDCMSPAQWREPAGHPFPTSRRRVEAERSLRGPTFTLTKRKRLLSDRTPQARPRGPRRVCRLSSGAGSAGGSRRSRRTSRNLRGWPKRYGGKAGGRCGR
jgi:hypothetical protein